MDTNEKSSKTYIPTWDGNPRTFDRYLTAIEWCEAATKYNERRYLVAKLLVRLTGAAAVLVAKWKARDFDRSDGVQVYISRLQKSPLPRQALPDAVYSFEAFFEKRKPDETMSNYIVREADTYQTFLDSSRRLVDALEDKSLTALDGKSHSSSRATRSSSSQSSQTSAKDQWWWNRPWRGRNEQSSQSEPQPPPSGDGNWQADMADRMSEAGDQQPEDDQSRWNYDHTRQWTDSGSWWDSGWNTHSTPDWYAADEESKSDDADTEFEGKILKLIRGWRLLQKAGLTREQKLVVIGDAKGMLDYDTIAC